MKDVLAEQLTPSQREAVFHREGPILVVAGPGSGKTRVITYRIAALVDAGVKPHNICAITFTNKAADEMRQRTAALGPGSGAHISTFHSLCVRILRRYADKAGITPSFSIYDESDQVKCVKKAVKDCDLDTTNFSPARVLEAISQLKNNLMGAGDFAEKADDFFSTRLAKIYARYQGILAECNALDFDDLLMKAALLLEGSQDVCVELGERFRFLLIDEYQDTNHAQYRIAKALVSRHNNICATGDPDQSIYGWRGADIKNILAFEKDWPDATIVKLEENFRSSANILEAADKLIAHNLKRKEKRLVPTKPAGKDITVDVFEDEADEAWGVVQKIRDLAQNGMALSEIAVFYRVNAMSRSLEEALIKEQIPYQVVRGVEFYNRREIRDMLAYLKVLVNPKDEAALLRIINTPARGIGKTTVDNLQSYAVRSGIALIEAVSRASAIASLTEAARMRLTAFVKMLGSLKNDIAGRVAPLAERVFVESGLEKSLRTAGSEGEDALENVRALIEGMAWYDQQAEPAEGGSLAEYLQQIALFSDADSYDNSRGQVALMTLHAAKGLEFENVFIVGVEEGLLPHERSVTGSRADLEEERRLFFVGITRAKAGLHISRAMYRSMRGEMLRTIPSQFLFELGLGAGELADDDAFGSSEETAGECAEEKFLPGDLVRHGLFGLGRVERYVDMGENSIVDVRFNSGQRKSLAVKYARLSRM